MDSTLRLGDRDLAPVTEWLDEIRTWLDGLTRVEWLGDLRRASSDEWHRLHRAITCAVSPDRAQRVLGDFLARIGFARGDSTSTADEIAAEEIVILRRRILAHRRGLTIEDYAIHLTPPPFIEV